MAATRSSQDLRIYLLGALLLGLGQQVFVVLRNPWLVDEGWSPAAVPLVQAAGGLAGVVAGAAGLLVSRRLRARHLLALCATLQAAGFALQLVCPSAFWLVLVGATTAGLGIQLHLVVSPPVLHASTAPEHRVAAFAASGLVLAPAAGLLGVGMVGGAELATEEAAAGQPLALALAAGVTALAVVPFARIAAGPAPAAAAVGAAYRARAATIVLVYAILGLAGGLTVPFLQLYFRLAHDAGPTSIASLYGVTMLAGAVALVAAPALARRTGLWQAVLVLHGAAVIPLAALAVAPGAAGASVAFVARHVLAVAGITLLHAFTQAVATESDRHALASAAVLATSAAWVVGTAAASPLLAWTGGRFDEAFALSAVLQAIAVALAARWLPALWRARPDDVGSAASRPGRDDAA